MKEKEAISILYQLAQGIQYLSQMGITHRDLKLENIFIDMQGAQGVYKIGDFGFAEQKKEHVEVFGTLPYMAPEIIMNQKYDNKVDVWSLGVIGHQLLFGKLYF